MGEGEGKGEGEDDGCRAYASRLVTHLRARQIVKCLGVEGSALDRAKDLERPRHGWRCASECVFGWGVGVVRCESGRLSTPCPSRRTKKTRGFFGRCSLAQTVVLWSAPCRRLLVAAPVTRLRPMLVAVVASMVAAGLGLGVDAPSFKESHGLGRGGGGRFLGGLWATLIYSQN